MFRSAYADVDIPNASLTDFVLGAAQEHSAKPALVDSATGLVLTYGQLLEQVRRVAAGLAALGIRKGDVVALWSPNSPDFAVAFHAIVRLGAIVTPANPANTSHELARQLDDAGAKVLVTSSRARGQGARRDRERQRGRSSSSRSTTPPTACARSNPSRSTRIRPLWRSIPTTDVVVLPYSSGTTGLPKGVMLTHRNLVANLDAARAIEHRT